MNNIEIAVPSAPSTPTTPFLTELVNSSYSRWLSFDFTDKPAFFKTLGEGLLRHTSVNYKTIGTYIDRIWTPKIQTLLSANYW